MVKDTVFGLDDVTNVANRVRSDRTTSYSSPAAKPLQSSNPEPIPSSVLPNTSVEPVNNTTKSQSERIEAM